MMKLRLFLFTSTNLCVGTHCIIVLCVVSFSFERCAHTARGGYLRLGIFLRNKWLSNNKYNRNAGENNFKAWRQVCVTSNCWYLLTSGSMSASRRHRGLFSSRAQRSQSALTMAATAKCMTPFSGPICKQNSQFVFFALHKCKYYFVLMSFTQRNCDSLVSSRQNSPNRM